ncbi:hypothetical protein GME_03197 [Halomonas sp. TD01]|nr:hypothetical protein GME_03197 [Halomonas sp. TD01]
MLMRLAIYCIQLHIFQDKVHYIKFAYIMLAEAPKVIEHT